MHHAGLMYRLSIIAHYVQGYCICDLLPLLWWNIRVDCKPKQLKNNIMNKWIIQIIDSRLMYSFFYSRSNKHNSKLSAGNANTVLLKYEERLPGGSSSNLFHYVNHKNSYAVILLFTDKNYHKKKGINFNVAPCVWWDFKFILNCIVYWTMVWMVMHLPEKIYCLYFSGA